MKRPISITLITKGKDLKKEIHFKYETETNYPRLEILKFFFKVLFKLNLNTK